MELEQLAKQVEWLDEERRRDKNGLISVEERLNTLDGNIKTVMTQIKELSSNVSRLTALMTRMDQLDEAMLKHRVDTKTALDEIEKAFSKREDEAQVVLRAELRNLDTAVAEIRKEITAIVDLRRGLQTRVDEDLRIARAVDEVNEKVVEIKRSEEEYNRQYRLLEDGRRQDNKRLTDIQGELASLRKRADEQHGQLELFTTNMRKLESRLNEWEATESDRRKTQNTFFENQALQQVERDRVWKEWQTRFETIERQTDEIETYVQSLDETHRTVKRAQQALEELSQKVERRIGEMTEIQRLSEERFRQEWTTFKADDQKRWTNYTLTQEEQLSEAGKHAERLLERITNLEDGSQVLQDMLHLMNEQTEKQLQSLLAVVHEWVSAYEHTLGRSR
ncbi:MAG: hypothetical protein PHD58_10415 [Anaerolineales bacterium]|nr:hypothetical protein [Anaerolineales bacterium]